MEPATPCALCDREHVILRFLACWLLPARSRACARASCTFARAHARASARVVVIFGISEEEVVNPVARALAHNVGVVSRRDEANRLGGSGIEVASRVHALLHVVCG